MLADGLALEPGPALRRLQEAILVQDPSIAPVPVAPARRGNLPAPPSSFVDREQERARLAELLHEHRLVTLVGLPGVGKSRLALEAARALESELEGGVWLVQLERAGSPIDVPRLVAEAVDARGPEPLARVVARLAACARAGRPRRVRAGPRGGGARSLCRARRLPAGARARNEPRGAAHPRRGALRRRAARAARGGRGRCRRARRRWSSSSPGPGRRGPTSSSPRRRRRSSPRSRAGSTGCRSRSSCRGPRQRLRAHAARSPWSSAALGCSTTQSAADEARVALATLVEWSYDLLHADEKTLLQLLAVHRGGAGLDLARRTSQTGRGSTKPPSATCSARWSTSPSCR